jgi:hypothetical protein
MCMLLRVHTYGFLGIFGTFKSRNLIRKNFSKQFRIKIC